MTWTRGVIAVMFTILIIFACDTPPPTDGLAGQLADLIDEPTPPSSLDRVAPDNVTTLFENRHASIMRLTLPPGSRIPVHASGPRAVYALKDGELTRLDGEIPKIRLYDEGDADIWKAGNYALVNSGQSEVELLVATRSEVDLPQNRTPDAEHVGVGSSSTDLRNLAWNNDFRIAEILIPTNETRRVVLTHPFVVHSLTPIHMSLEMDGGEDIDMATEPRQTVWFEADSRPVLRSSDCLSRVVIFEFKQ